MMFVWNDPHDKLNFVDVVICFVIEILIEKLTQRKEKKEYTQITIQEYYYYRYMNERIRSNGSLNPIIREQQKKKKESLHIQKHIYKKKKEIVIQTYILIIHNKKNMYNYDKKKKE